MRRVVAAVVAVAVATPLLVLALTADGMLPAVTDVFEKSANALSLARGIASTHYAGAPALMICLSVLALVPVLAIAGLFLSDGPGKSPRQGAGSKPETTDEAWNWPSEAWIEVQGMPGRLYRLGRGLVRIGRDDENDIPIPENSVHRVHAIIHRTPEAQFVITDVSSRNGRGVVVNGTPVNEASLRPGDAIGLGHVTLKFIARPA